MVERILENLAATSWDFREIASPDDSLAEFFEDWIPYYRLKYAIARALQPRSILEIGVRFGYSAIAFLKGSPSAQFLGIDLDVESFGGEKGALEWARGITAGYRAEFLVADSQKMQRFPGGTYDFIHVDGQQDGKGTFHDLRLAVAQARWVLLDGYFWTSNNFFNANDFLLKFKDVISYSLILPGYAGELLIRVSDEHLARMASAPSTGANASGAIVEFYDSNYYLKDCGGHDSFRRTGGRQISDWRLLTLLSLSGLARGHSALDLGCGRGEVAYQLASRGFKVTAIDYSAASIALTRRCLDQAPESVRARARVVCADATTFEFGEQFDVALAGDLIEHLSPEELERLYASVARHLQPSGIFIIHTAPNLWFYQRSHRRRKLAVEALGGYLPVEPRTRYELLMHINEQSPARLRRSLARHFSHVKVWVADSREPAAGLRRKLTLREMADGREIYALASQQPLDLEKAAQLLSSEVIRAGEHEKVTVLVPDFPEKVPAGRPFELQTRVVNLSAQTLSSLPPHPIFISYHWFAADQSPAIVFDGERTSLAMGVAPNETFETSTRIVAPRRKGRCRLTVTLVQEGVCWFDGINGSAKCEAMIEVI